MYHAGSRVHFPHFWRDCRAPLGALAALLAGALLCALPARAGFQGVVAVLGPGNVEASFTSVGASLDPPATDPNAAERKEQKRIIVAAINLLRGKKTVQGRDLTPFADRLAEMLKNGKICVETSTGVIEKKVALVTTDETGALGGAEAMNVSPHVIRDDLVDMLPMLAAILAHECLHTMQGTDGDRTHEREAYRFEDQVLAALGFKQDHRRRDYLIKAWKSIVDPAVYVESDVYYVVPTIGTLFGYNAGETATHEFPLALGDPMDLVLLDGVVPPAGTHVVAVSGTLTHDDARGLIQFIAVRDGQGVGVLSTLSIPNSRPQSLVYDPALAALFVLDAFNRRILVVRDTDGDRVPDTLAPQPYAAAPRIETLFLNHAGDGYDLVASLRDWRGVDTVDFNEARIAFFDHNNDGVADASFPYEARAEIGFQPAFVSPPCHLNSGGTIEAMAGARFEVQLVDPSGPTVLTVLATGELGARENRRSVRYARPLREGEFLRVVDLTHSLPGSEPATRRVGGPPPQCRITNRGTDVLGRWFIEFTVQDAQSGLAAINVLTAQNVTVSVPPFPAGTTAPVLVRAVRIDPTQIPSVELEAVDTVGNTTVCH